jgi:hypothetical protein
MFICSFLISCLSFLRLLIRILLCVFVWPILSVSCRASAYIYSYTINMSSTLKPLPVTPRVRSISTPSVMSQSAASAGTTPQTIYFSGTSTEKEKETRWPRTAITRYNSLVSDWWLLEISSALLGAAAITALCIILREYDDKTLPQWKTVLGASLTLNTVLSVLGLVAKASLMIPVVECISQLKWAWYTKQHPLSDFHDFDEASRGVWGSIKLMWKLRGM